MQAGVNGGPRVRAFVTNSGSVLASGDYDSLGIEQLGIFKVYNTGKLPEATAIPNADTLGKFRIGFGSKTSEQKKAKNAFKHRKGFTSESDVTPILSPELDAKDIVGWEGIAAKTQGSSDIWALGYDGVDASKTLKIKYDHKYKKIAIKAWGQPIQQFNGGAKVWYEEFIIDKDFCVDLCSEEDCTLMDADKFADKFLKEFNERKWNSDLPFNKFIKATKIKVQDPTPTPPALVTFNKYVLSTCDDGTTSSLGALQVKYPGYKVEFESRSGAISTYSMWRPASAGAPASATFSGVSIPNCTTCPSGFTLVASAKVFTIKVAAGASAPVITGSISNTKISSTFVADTYLVYVPVATTIEDVQDDAGTGAIVTFINETEGVCTQNTPTTVAWVLSTTATKGSKDWTLTLSDTICGTSRLAEVQAAYPDLVVTAQSPVGTCARSYKTTTYSTPVEPGCYPEAHEFYKPEPFSNQIYWDEFVAAPLALPDCDEPTPATPECKSVGIIFEGGSFNKDISDCLYGYYDYQPWDYTPVHFSISINDQDFTKGIVCDDDEMPITKLRSAELIRGRGDYVRNVEKQSNLDDNKIWVEDLAVSSAFGAFPFSAQTNVFYDEYKLTVKKPLTSNQGIGGVWAENTLGYVIFVPRGKGKAIENLINPLVASLNNPNLKAVTL